MKNKYPLLLLFAALSCLGIQCKKERTELEMLPPVTTYGANTFGCLINGRAWPVYEKGGHSIDGTYYNGKLNIIYSIYEPDGGWGPGTLKQTITIRTEEIHSRGFYAIKPIFGENQFTMWHGGLIYSAHYGSNVNNICYITMHRLDSVKHVISGEFSFSLYDREGKSRVNVDHGRFDLFY
ncbi:MAG: hypothetical protein WC150_07010 [Bacteroidia bacterium]